MADRNQLFGQSHTMPPINLEQVQGGSHEAAHHEWKRALLNTPDLQRFRNNTASVWAPNGVQFLDPGIPQMANQFGDGSTDGDDVCSQSSSSTIKGVGKTDSEPHGLDKGKSRNALTPGAPQSHGFGATATSSVDLKYGDFFCPTITDAAACIESDTDATADFVQALPSPKTSTDLSSPWNPTSFNGKPRSCASSNADSDVTFMTDYSLTQSVGSADSTGCMSSTLLTKGEEAHRDLMVMLRNATIADKFPATKDLHVPETLHYSRDTSRLSSLPADPSPLGLGRVKNEALSDGSSLTRAPPNPAGSQIHQQEHAAPQSSSIYGLHKRDVEFDSNGSPFQKSVRFGSSHGRIHTDPFIEQTEILPSGSRNTAQYLTRFDLLSPLPLNTPSSTTSSQFLSMVPHARDARTPNLPNLTPVTREELAIPPPPLPFVQHKYTHSPGARAVLDAQKVFREAWIRTGAKKIADLNRARFVAAQQYAQTHSAEDYQVWGQIEAALAHAINLDKRQEERRNMSLPQDMTPMRTGPDNRSSDGSAAWMQPYQNVKCVSSGGEGAGRLLGSQMAFMERVCAEVKHPAQAEGEEEGGSDHIISTEMLNTLSTAEKRALRDHLVARLKRDTARRACN